MAYSNSKESITSKSFMKRHPKGELPHSRCVVPGLRLTLALRDVQVLDTLQIATSSRLPGDDETTGVSNVPGMSDQDTEARAPPDYFTRGLLPKWDTLELHGQLLRALHQQSFTEPTPIQSKALPPALRGKDVVGVAETVCARFIYFPQTPTLAQGSGKTLAYGLPILHKLLSRTNGAVLKSRRPVCALILAPTRELALQISSHLNACLNDVHTPDERLTSNILKAPKLPPLVSVAAIVGGMSPHKQKRILSRGVDVLVATPGRLWDIMQEVCNIQRSVNFF